MSAENSSNPLANLDYFDPEIVRDAEALFGPVDRPVIEGVLASPVVEAQVAILALSKSLRESGTPEQVALVNMVHETALGVLSEEAQKTHHPLLHAAALYLASHAVGRQFNPSTPEAE